MRRLRSLGAVAARRRDHSADGVHPRHRNTPVSGLLTDWVIDTMGGEMGHWMRRCEDVHMAVNVPPEVLGRGGV